MDAKEFGAIYGDVYGRSQPCGPERLQLNTSYLINGTWERERERERQRER